MTPTALPPPEDLRCAGCCQPLAVDEARPFLSWRFGIPAKPEPAARQQAYRLLVASRVELLTRETPDLWDSGRIESSATFEIAYEGQRVPPGRRAYWTVQVWNAHGVAGDYTPPSFWETGCPDADSWSPARWVAPDYSRWAPPWPAPYLRREFTLASPPVRARAYVSGLGYHEFYVNGSRCGDAVLEPAQTDYDLTAFYVAHDITAQLRHGANVLGFVLGEGWFHQQVVWPGSWEPYGQPGAIAKVVIECADGSEQLIVTDRQWQATDGPIRANNVYAGETYDARHELPGWSEPGAPVGDWQPVNDVPPLTPKLRAQMIPPIRRTATLPTVTHREVTPRTWVYDFGQNFAGWTQLRVTAPRDTEICLRFSEDVFGDGSINPLSTGVVHTGVVQTDRYVCHGLGEEIWEPRFTYHGFRYVEVTGLTGQLPLDLLTGIVVHSDLPSAGSFACSDALLNRLHETARWTLRSNLHGVPTDCPARERCGWLGDAHTITDVTLANFDSANFWLKYHRDIINTRGRSGDRSDPRVPANIAPGQRHCGQANPDWAVALVLIPWHVHLYSGAVEPLRETYPAMRDFLDYLEELAPNHVIESGYGDWCPPGSVEPVECAPALSSTALYYRVLGIMAKIAATLGHLDDAIRYQRLADQVRAAFLARFFDAINHTFGCQTADTLALAHGLVPSEKRSHVAASLARHITAGHRGHFHAGIHGLRHLFDVLCQHGHADVAWQAIQIEGFPGFRHHFGLGATTFWEMFYDPRMHQLHDRSLNHPMQAAFAAWLLQGIGGIRPNAEAPGFRRFTLEPHLWQQLAWAEATHASTRGPIRSHWESTTEQFHWSISVPANTTAVARMPVQGRPHLRLNGTLLPIADPSAAFAEVELPPGSHELVASS